MGPFNFLAIVLLFACLVRASSDSSTNTLSVHLTSGSFAGESLAANGTERWLGIPFAQPPLGSLRFKAPVAITRPSQILRNATQFGNACPQAASAGLGASISEDCLFLNVWRPSGTTTRDKLPALVWFYGGAFMDGAASDPSFDPTRILARSVTIGKPIMFISVNYRVNTFGFLPRLVKHEPQLASSHVPTEDLNAGLLDQRAALTFLQDNIGMFGGDPAKLNEGTSFSQSLLNLNTPSAEEDAAFVTFIKDLMIDPSTITNSTFDTLISLYPANDSSLGGAFNTGDSLYDRGEAWYTDNMYLSARRLLFAKAAPLQPLFAYFFEEFIPGNPTDLGVYHGSELGLLFGPVPNSIEDDFANQLTDFYINFINDLNPGSQWPQYELSTKKVLQLMRNNVTVIPDEDDIPQLCCGPGAVSKIVSRSQMFYAASLENLSVNGSSGNSMPSD
ncbi:hypothetical protein PHLCEN_2v2893 [Hermanssonia centrifuga]|uniref:Carboxylesterase type B domain-containing protein n=1 Tax=Hermanssonia centrifuga TaxID=98765 RepID=A0A2R6RIA7_9APHY|nr:hypothetical protein PHLCEN_2v2893 [Hermanssonia centrifuga]